ncbi:MAG: hypothetical protein WCR21_09415, partial [Bacteroidota bacterium]
ISEKGFCYSSTDIPNIDDNRTPSTNGFVDLFEAEIKGLLANTTYQVRAYTKFSDGAVVMGDVNQFSTNGVYMVGDKGPNNGVIISTDNASATKYLEAIVTNIPSYPWGCAGTDIGSLSLTGSGASNSNIIKNICGSNTAAAYCLNLSVNGVGGWYLPSISELSYLYSCAKNNPGIIPAYQYWSSSHWDGNLGYGVDLTSTSDWKKFNKSSALRVVAVKGFN